MRIFRLVRNTLGLALLAFVATGGGGPLRLWAQDAAPTCPTCGDCTCCNCESCEKGIFWTCKCGGCKTTEKPAVPAQT
jgi:hypothetical protein